MEQGDESGGRSGWALDIVAFGLWLGVFLGGAGVALFLVVVTAAGILGDNSNSTATVSGRLNPPYEIELENGNGLIVDDGGRTTLNSADGSELYEGFQETTVETMVPIADGRWQGVASTALLVPLFVLAWTRPTNSGESFNLLETAIRSRLGTSVDFAGSPDASPRSRSSEEPSLLA